MKSIERQIKFSSILYSKNHIITAIARLKPRLSRFRNLKKFQQVDQLERGRILEHLNTFEPGALKLTARVSIRRRFGRIELDDAEVEKEMGVIKNRLMADATDIDLGVIDEIIALKKQMRPTEEKFRQLASDMVKRQHEKPTEENIKIAIKMLEQIYDWNPFPGDLSQATYNLNISL